MIKYNSFQKAFYEQQDNITDLINELSSIGIHARWHIIEINMLKEFAFVTSESLYFANFLFKKHKDKLIKNNITDIDYIYSTMRIGYSIQDHMIAVQNYKTKNKSAQNILSENEISHLYGMALQETEDNKQKFNVLGINVDLMNLAFIFLNKFIKEDPSSIYDHHALAALYAIEFEKHQ